MNTFKIKLLAIVTMAIDHLGAYFYTNVFWLRLIGRISFPLFAWMIANGAEYTRDIKKYLLRVWILAFISQIPYLLTNQIDTPGFWELNAIFTLATGLSVIAIWKRTNNEAVRTVAVVAGCLLAYVLKMDYAAAGVLSVLVFYIYRHNKRDIWWAQLALVGMFYILPAINQVFGGRMGYINLALFVNPLQLLALPVIFAYNGKPGPKFKFWFYAFFPVHYLIMYLIKLAGV